MLRDMDFRGEKIHPMGQLTEFEGNPCKLIVDMLTKLYGHQEINGPPICCLLVK